MTRKAIVVWLSCIIAGATHDNAYALHKTLVSDQLTDPLFATAPASDSARLFVVQRSGQIRILIGDSLVNTPFLTIAAKVIASDEQGLLGMAFDPDYATNGFFYVDYVAKPNGRTVISRFHVSGGNPEIADTAETVILQIPDFADNHNGGMLAFGPTDGYLYMGMGDGGSAGDPGNRAQNPDSLLGKMLRIDVDPLPYTIPPNNPFVAPDTARHEIWAIGMRNPWRWSFDRLTADLWIADVGQDAHEEIDWQPASSPGGENYGWRRKEGFACYNPSSNCDPSGLYTDPITSYDHTGNRCSITGGYVYRGCAVPEAYGMYFYGDYCTGEVWGLRYDGVNKSDSTDFTDSLGFGSSDLASFGEDARGELYLIGISSGTVWRLTGVNPPESCQVTCPVTMTGDVNVDQVISSSDIIVLVNYVFKAGPPPQPIPQAGDVNCSTTISSADIIHLVNYVFKAGPAPCDVCSIL